MELSFPEQSAAFLWSLVLGVLLGVVYGGFRLVRVTFSLRRAAVFILDFLFMLLAAAAIFLFCIGMMRGYVRSYVLLGAAFGFFAYRLTLGRLFCMIYHPILVKSKKIMHKISGKMKKITKKLLKIAAKLLYNESGKKYRKPTRFRKRMNDGTVKKEAGCQKDAGAGKAAGDRRRNRPKGSPAGQKKA